MNGWWKDIIGALVACIVILLLASHTFGEMVEVGPIRQCKTTGVLGELESRLLASDIGSYPGKPDQVSVAHGLAHDLNAAVRNRHGGTNKVNASYVPGGHSLLLPEPTNLTLSEVRNNTIKRGRWELDNEMLYGTVYRGRRTEGWNNQPLYLLDELSAYCCGTVAGIENGLSERTKQSVGFAQDVYEHCLVMAHLARLRGYPHANELDAFLRYAGEYIERLTFQTLDPGVDR